MFRMPLLLPCHVMMIGHMVVGPTMFCFWSDGNLRTHQFIRKSRNCFNFTVAIVLFVMFFVLFLPMRTLFGDKNQHTIHALIAHSSSVGINKQSANESDKQQIHRLVYLEYSKICIRSDSSDSSSCDEQHTPAHARNTSYQHKWTEK